MAEVYTVALNSQTPVEILEGRVGHFWIYPQGFPNASMGGEDMGSPVYPDPEIGGQDYRYGTVENSIPVWPTSDPLHLYVTSPDEVFVVCAHETRADSGSPWVGDSGTNLVIFHNR